MIGVAKPPTTIRLGDWLDRFLLNHAGWVLLAAGLTLVLGLMAAIVAGVTFIFAADLTLYLFVRGVVVGVCLLVTFLYWLGSPVEDLLMNRRVGRPDLVTAILIFVCLLGSIAVILLNPVTRNVLMVSLVDGVLLLVAVEVQVKTDSDSDDWDYLWNTLPVRWWRVQVTGLLTGLVVGLFLLSGQTLVVTRPEEILTLADYALFGSFWVSVWVGVTFVGSVLVNGVDLDHKSKRLA